MTSASFPVLSGQFGVLVVTVNVLLDQLGLPVPAIPTLIVAGALVAGGQLPLPELLIATSLVCVIADASWYLAGRVWGNRVMRLLCRVSLTPDSCVSQTQNYFERLGPNAIILAKFVPGLALIAPPLAGATRMRLARFLSLTTLGSALWIGAALAIGACFRSQIAYVLPRIAALGRTAALALLVLVMAYVLFKWWQRRRLYAALRMARMTVKELYALMDAGAAPLVVDVRSATARTLDPRHIPGAIHLPLEGIESRLATLPQDREIVLYCTCPNEASAARVAQVLMKNGFKRVRPLEGGLDAWVAAGYSVDAFAVIAQRTADARETALESSGL
jgi:membrane protein DedA with SNARE-associated domain/rhodanese-related sulfurtransferase